MDGTLQMSVELRCEEHSRRFCWLDQATHCRGSITHTHHDGNHHHDNHDEGHDDDHHEDEHKAHWQCIG